MKKDKNALGAHEYVNFEQTICHWSFYIFQSFFPLSELQDCRSIDTITNSFPRLQIHFQDYNFIYKIKIHLYDRKFSNKITMHKQDCNSILKIANAFVSVQMLL